NSQNIAPVSDADRLNSVKLPKIKQENLELKADNTPVKVINLVAQSILTRGSEEILPSIDGKFVANRDFNKACVIERHGHSGGIGVSAIKGYNIENGRSEEHTSELQSRFDIVCRLLLEKKNRDKRQRRSPVIA